MSLAFSLIECGPEHSYGHWDQEGSFQHRSGPSAPRQRAGQEEGYCAFVPSCSVTFINGDRSRSLQEAKLTLTVEDRDHRALPPCLGWGSGTNETEEGREKTWKRRCVSMTSSETCKAVNAWVKNHSQSSEASVRNGVCQ